MNQVASEFRRHCDLQDFYFCRIYPDSSFVSLATDHQWPEDHFLLENKLPATARNFDTIQSSIYLPAFHRDNDFGWDDGTIQTAKDRYDIVNPLLMVKKYNDFNEVMIYSLKNENAPAYFMNNLGLFEKFLFYFKDQASELIATADKNPVKLEGHQINSHSKTSNSEPKIPKLPKHSFWLYYHNRWVKLSNKEYQVLSLTAHGFPIPEISEELFISKRTVETHVVNIKIKFQEKSKTEIIKAYWNNINTSPLF